MPRYSARTLALGHGKGGHTPVLDQAGLRGSGIVAEGMPVAVGATLALEKFGDTVAISLFGEGAANQGAFHESLNLAALWDLPVVLIAVPGFDDTEAMVVRG